MATHTYGGGGFVLALGFSARLSKGESEPSDEELDSLDFAWSHDREQIRKALKHP